MSDQQIPQDSQLSAVPQTAPTDPSQGSYGPSSGYPGVDPNDAAQEAQEVELRDIAGACIADALEVYMKAGKAALGSNDMSGAKDIASAVLSLTQAVVLLAPVEHLQPGEQVNGNTPLPPKHLPPRQSASFALQQMAKQPGA